MPTTHNKSGSTRLAACEAWVDEHSGWLALGIILAAFAIRVAYAASCFLNPDEAQHFAAARSVSWLGAYQASRTLAHPPLLILVLHGILFLGSSEVILRMPSLIGGTAALWLTFAWVRRYSGGTAALGGLGFIALSPMAITASTEVRQYGLLLFFVCAALYATERTFAERSTKWAVFQGLFLLGAILTDYTSVVPIAALGLYVLLRSIVDGVPRRLLITICAIQLFLATVLGLLYLAEVRGMTLKLDYLQDFYYSASSETLLGFLRRALSKTFLYAVGTYRLSLLLMFAFLFGCVALLAGRTKARGLMAVLVISPFVVGLVAAIFQVLPFAGSRHQTYLLPFVAAGISAALACWPRGWAVPLLLLGAVIAPHWLTAAVPDNNPRIMPIADMTAAVSYIARTVPRGAPIFVDDETRYMLRYYLGRNEPLLRTLQSGPVVEQWYGGQPVVRLTHETWALRPDEALDQAEESARALDVPSGAPLWIVSVAWDSITQPPEHRSLASRLPPAGDRGVREFGIVSVIRVPGTSQVATGSLEQHFAR